MLDFNHNPTLSDQITDLIDVGINLERAQEVQRDYLGASRLGVSCDRALQFEFLATPTPNPSSWLDFSTAEDQDLAGNINPENTDVVVVNDLGIQQYLDVLFGFLDEGFIPLRCFSESTKQQNAPYNIWVDNDEHAAGKVVNFANYCHSNKQACYLIPGLVSAEKQAKSVDIIQMGVLLVDLDDGDIEAKLKHAIQFIGDPTLVVESGGTTTDGKAKLHAYWKLSEPVDQSDLESLLKLRAQLAQKIGGDTHFKSAHQPIRIAGSVHHKHDAREVSIRQHIENEYHLLDLDESVSGMPNINGIATVDQLEFLDFNTAADKVANVDTALTTQVREGGQDDITRFESMSIVMGHYIRLAHDGRITPAECWDAITAHNQVNLDPPWQIERVTLEADRLWKKHIEKNGPASDAANHEPQSLEWIPKNTTKKRAFEEGRIIRDAILRLEDRHAMAFANTKTREKTRMIIIQEIHDICEQARQRASKFFKREATMLANQEGIDHDE